MSSRRGTHFGKRLSKKGTGQHLMSNKELLETLKAQGMVSANKHTVIKEEPLKES